MAERLNDSLQAALADLAKWLDETRISAVIIGGVAASVLGRPRLTRDIDALAILPEDAWSDAMDAAAAYGIVPRIDAALVFARRSRVLLMRHAGSSIDNGLLDAHPETDVAEVRACVREFASAASMPDMLRELDDLLARRRR